MKSKIVFEKHDYPVSNKTVYRVVGLTNRTVPIIGTELTKEEVDSLIVEVHGLTVEIKPSKESRRIRRN